MGKLYNKVAIVTGGAMGMGYGSARKMAQYGAKVTLIDFSDEVHNTVEKMRKEGFTVDGYQANVRDLAQLQKIYKEVAEKHGKLDILVNAAGIGGGMKYLVDPAAEEARDNCFGVNFYGIWNSCKSAVPHMIQAKYGKIVNFASVTGCMVVDPGMTAYASTKGAVMAFTKALASELAAVNITVNAILPGVINTPMMQKSAAKACPENPQSVLDAIAASIPMRRLGTPEEAGDVVSFLASDESSYVTGIGLVFDGGNTLPETRDTGWTPDVLTVTK